VETVDEPHRRAALSAKFRSNRYERGLSVFRERGSTRLRSEANRHDRATGPSWRMQRYAGTEHERETRIPRPIEIAVGICQAVSLFLTE
jgi:hypothetical protein